MTINRWVIEALNGIYHQNFKALKSIRNTLLPHIMDDFKIASSLINCFFSACNKADHLSISVRMKSSLKTE